MALPPIAVTEVALSGISRYYNISGYSRHITNSKRLPNAGSIASTAPPYPRTQNGTVGLYSLGHSPRGAAPHKAGVPSVKEKTRY